MTNKTDSPALTDGKLPESRRPWALSTPPPFPAVALRVMSILAGEDRDAMNQVVLCIQSDPVFTGEVLRVANSALFGVSHEIKTVQNAVVVLGLDFIKALAVTVGMRAYVRSSMRIPILRSCWNHSLASAWLSRELATACGAAGDEAYTAGVLHDIGRIGLMASYPVEYANMLSVSYEYSFDLLQCERDLFDIDHCQAGAWLAGEWKLPQVFALVAEHHHDEPDRQGSGMIHCASLGCRLADTLGFSVTGTSRVWPLEEIRACLPASAQARFPSDAEDMKTRVAAHVRGLG